MRLREAATRPYAGLTRDAVRQTFEEPIVERLMPRLRAAAGGGEVLDLGCGDGLVERLAGDRLDRYVGVDLEAHPGAPAIAHDLRDGLGPVGTRPFNVYVATFGVASHLAPRQLERLLREIARHARPGAVVAIEALGLLSLEWPRLWDAAPGPARMIPYRMASDVRVHPWTPTELGRLLRDSGIRPLGALDRTLQAGPKTGEGRYWPALPPLRAALNGLLEGAADTAALRTPLPPLPAGVPALVHHRLAQRRRALLERTALTGAALARAIWRLEPWSAGGFGHGVLVVGRVR